MRLIPLSLVAFAALSAPAVAHDFSWDTMVRAAMKLDADFDYEANVDSWMQVYRRDVWRRYHQDEFAMEEKRQQTIAMMKRAVAEFDLSEEIVLQTQFEVGQYDFTKHVFPVKKLSTTNYWYTSSRSNTGSLPYRFRIFFANPELLQAIPVEKEAARRFVKSRVDRYGRVDRGVTATVRLKVKKPKGNPGDFLVEIQSARLYHDKDRTRLLHEFKKPAPKPFPKRSPEDVKRTSTGGTPSTRKEVASGR